MKKLLGTLIVLAVLVMGGYYVAGVGTERQLKKGLIALNQSNGVYAEIEQYNRGWFSSDVKLNWKIQIPEQVKDVNGKQVRTPAENIPFATTLHVMHGPIMLTKKGLMFGQGYASTSYPIPEKFASQINQEFTVSPAMPALNIDWKVGLLGSNQVDMNVPAFMLKEKKNQGMINWGGFNASVAASSDHKKLSGNFVISQLDVNRDKQMVKVDGFNVDYDLHQFAPSLYIGDASIAFPSMVVMNDATKMFEVDGVTMSTSTDVSSGLLSSHLDFGFEKIFADGRDFGPLSVEMALRNLDADAMVRINKIVQESQAMPEQQRQRAMMGLMTEVPKLLSKGAEFEVSDFQFKMSEGTMSGNMMVNLPAVSEDKANPMQMMKNIKGHAQLSVPVQMMRVLLAEKFKAEMSNPGVQQAMMQQLQQQAGQNGTTAPSLDDMVNMRVNQLIAKIKQNGLMEQNGDNLVVMMNLESGSFTVNGKPFSPAMMQF